MHRRFTFLGWLWGFLGAAGLLAQQVQHVRTVPSNAIPVLNGPDTLYSAWAGGLSFPRFDQLDVDQDGLRDLLVFDRAESRLLVFRNTGQTGDARWQLAPELAARFPLDSLSGWIALRDFNQDGKPDLFTAAGNSFRVWRNTTPVGGPLQWVPVPGLILTRYDTAFFQQTTPLYTQNSDVPGIVDVDADGDLDFLVFTTGGNLIEYHKNVSLDSLGVPDSLLLINASQCWGHIVETNPTPNTFTLVTSQNCGNELRTGGSRHFGGGLLPLNLNGDSLMDILVSDDLVPYMAAGINTGTRRIADVTVVDSLFPANDVRLKVHTFPVGFYVDADDDGTRDLLAAPNSESGSIDWQQVLHYRNIGTDSFPVFMRQNKVFLAPTLLDVGSGAAPVFADLNADGLPDLLIGNQRFTDSANYSRSALQYYRNTGTLAQPRFVLESSNYLNLIAEPTVSLLRPAFGDLDADGDPDLLLGCNNRLRYYRNDAPTGQPAQWVLVSTDYASLLGQGYLTLSPLLLDWDGDTDLDLLCGQWNGRVLYLENMGTAQNASYTLVTNQLGEINVSDALNPGSGKAAPTLADLENDGIPELLVGSQSGRVFVFGPLGGNPLQPLPFKGFLHSGTIGSQVVPAQYPAWLPVPGSDSVRSWVATGTQAGGVLLHQVWYSASILGLQQQAFAGAAQPLLYPNPAHNWVTFQAPARCTINVFSTHGSQLLNTSTDASGHFTFQVAKWPPGLYFVQWQGAGGAGALRLCVFEH